jgi:DNA repair exonuclease SbcCD nuclease subunit
MIKNIVHIADIHIRLLQRHKEYRSIFSKLYEQLKNDKTLNPDESIILLAGDILHSKTDLSPEAIELTSEFLTKLCEIMPVVMIAGNHDGNLSNNSRLDALSPIVDALKIKNLYYLKDTGVYDFDENIQFGLASVFDKTLPNVAMLDQNKIKIALYHGVVDESKTETNFTLSSAKFNVASFSGYDLVLLGDIHKPFQFLNESKTIAYPGSLIAQNYGEPELNRGYLI